MSLKSYGLTREEKKVSEYIYFRHWGKNIYTDIIGRLPLGIEFLTLGNTNVMKPHEADHKWIRGISY